MNAVTPLGGLVRFNPSWPTESPYGAFYQRQQEVIQYGIDWTGWIDPATVASVQWSTSFALSLTGETQNGNEVLVFVGTQNAQRGVDYDVTCSIVTSTGERQTGKIRLKVR